MKALKIINIIIVLCICFDMRAQNIGINTTGTTPDAAAILDMNTGNNYASPNGRGLLIPNVILASTTDVTTIPISTNDTSLLVYNKKASTIGTGFYYWSGSAWTELATGTPWSLYGNSGTLPGLVTGDNYLGTSDNNKLLFGVNDQKAGELNQTGPTFWGYLAGLSNTSSSATGIGFNAAYSNTTGTGITAIGYKTLYNNTTEPDNTGVGDSALFANISGCCNTAVGALALYNNNGSSNVGCGFEALYTNINGNGNAGMGYKALFSALGSTNVGVGYEAGYNYTGSNNIFIGDSAGYSTTSATGITFIGYNAGAQNTIGVNNTVTGYKALHSNITGSSNTGVGYEAGYNNNADQNVFVGDSAGVNNSAGNAITYAGYKAGVSNTTGINNTAIGYEASYADVTGNNNIAVGYQALYSNTGSNNSAIGYKSLYTNNIGQYNSAMGDSALYNNNGNANTAVGDEVLYNNTTGINNCASGAKALYSSTNASSNTALGYYAGYNNTGDQNIFIGDSAGYINTTGTQNTFVGYQAGITAGTTAYTNITCLGYQSAIYTATASNSINLGNASISHICAASAMTITAYSDRRIKDSIKENVPGLAFITKLRPVTYHLNIHRENEMLGIKDDKDWPGKYDVEKITQSGFIAQQVDSAAQACGYDFNGLVKPATPGGLYGLGYTCFVVPLVKAVQEQQQIMDSLKAEHQILNAHYSSLNAQYSNLSDMLQKVQNENMQTEAKDEADIAELKKMLMQVKDSTK